MPAVLENIMRAISSLYLHVPLLMLLVPVRANHLVSQVDILAKSESVGNPFEILQDLGCT